MLFADVVEFGVQFSGQVIEHTDATVMWRHAAMNETMAQDVWSPMNVQIPAPHFPPLRTQVKQHIHAPLRARRRMVIQHQMRRQESAYSRLTPAAPKLPGIIFQLLDP